MSKGPKVVNTGGSDQEILTRATCVVEIAGNEYEWNEVGRRQARAMLGEMIPIVSGFVEGQDKPEKLLLLLNDSLEFFFKWHTKMRSDRKTIEDNASNDEITTALMAIREVIDCPFRRDIATAKRAAEMTPTPNQES